MRKNSWKLSVVFFSNGNVCEYTESWPRWTYKAYLRNKCIKMQRIWYIHTLVYTFLLTKDPQFTHQVLTNPPVSPKTFQSRRRRRLWSLWKEVTSKQHVKWTKWPLGKEEKSLFAGTTCKGCRFVKVGWFWDWWFVEGDPGWGMNDRWFLDMSQSSKARKLYKQVPAEWFLNGC